MDNNYLLGLGNLNGAVVTAGAGDAKTALLQAISAGAKDISDEVLSSFKDDQHPKFFIGDCSLYNSQIVKGNLTKFFQTGDKIVPGITNVQGGQLPKNQGAMITHISIGAAYLSHASAPFTDDDLAVAEFRPINFSFQKNVGIIGVKTVGGTKVVTVYGEGDDAALLVAESSGVVIGGPVELDDATTLFPGLQNGHFNFRITGKDAIQTLSLQRFCVAKHAKGIATSGVYKLDSPLYIPDQKTFEAQIEMFQGFEYDYLTEAVAARVELIGAWTLPK